MPTQTPWTHTLTIQMNAASTTTSLQNCPSKCCQQLNILHLSSLYAHVLMVQISLCLLHWGHRTEMSCSWYLSASRYQWPINHLHPPRGEEDPQGKQHPFYSEYISRAVNREISQRDPALGEGVGPSVSQANQSVTNPRYESMTRGHRLAHLGNT